ncbi:spermidine/putrescine transport system substrate-binding protein [Pseudoxanthobacter soli DSM 19599]|uniref:Spermidine/putrescine transport system substrate-binding protein n=1 Tax=Pseudoxanthobacter soli DSM 19599 TaxID=1123029 RepID=A0A1M7ZR72_9HYPH|nr:PotD/PotF family extracellular solute-binding protein [Pseudoxanthobacter soli]SHO67400.1 spermidine/putrescine transport system substrate-binding protein [Pseudoxanthobacter soli DSM 19599]
MELNRRSVLKGMAASGLALAGTSLGGIGPAFAAREKELNILCWEGYNSAQVLDPFRTEYGATVKAESLTNDPTMINRLRAGEINIWDLINVNNPWARKVMFPEKLIKPLPRAEFEPYFDKMLPMFKPPYKWAMDESGTELLGMCQRFGPYSFVVNTDKISRDTAEKTGWDLFLDPALAGKYGILESDDWNVFNIFVLAGIDPFKVHDEAELAKFSETAKTVFKNAKMIGDIATMNQALVSGEIDLHLTGGTYSVSPARADGYLNLRGITPLKGPLPGGKGGIAWIEITSTVNNPNLSPLAQTFLKYVQEPEVAHRVAFAEGTYNPVAQMGNPECFKLFTKDELEAIQWDSLDEEMARSVEYDIVPDYDKALDLMNAAKRLRG